MGEALLGMGSNAIGTAFNSKLPAALNSKGSAAHAPRRYIGLAPGSVRCSWGQHETHSEKEEGSSSRRAAVVQLGAALIAVQELCGRVGSTAAVGQSMLAGRIPGLSDPDGAGLRTYRRPDAKSGGHGVGWSPIIPYSFKVPTDWTEVPVSIADLGGTEIDLRFQSASEGNISVVVAPVLRFSSLLGDNVNIEDVGVPQKVIDAFGPELTGETVEGKVKSMDVKAYGGRTYYQYELEVPHMLISATAAGNRLYLFSASGNGRQWKKFFSNLKDIRDSFRVG